MDSYILHPVTIQYLVGMIISLTVSCYVLLRNPKSMVYRYFFLFGISVGLWQCFAFLHRNAPTATVSKDFMVIFGGFVYMVLGFLTLTVMAMERNKSINSLIILPALGVSILEILTRPIEIIASPYGWTYRFTGVFTVISGVIWVFYLSTIILVGLTFIRRNRIPILRKKYSIILFAVITFHGVALTISNYILMRFPNFPPLAGLLSLLMFLFVAYAILIPTEKIVILSELKKPHGELSKSYLEFLNKFQAKIPGKELGESIFRFWDYIEAMGLKDVVTLESEKLVFDLDRFVDEDINDISDNILKIMKEHRWAMETIDNFTPLLVGTYETLRLKSKSGANEWFEQMLKRHGTFLAEQGILAVMPKQVKIPKILRKLQSGRTYLFQEEKPAKAYQLMKETLRYGFASLCISKLHPGKVKERYDVGEDSIFWLTFEKGERTISPKDIDKLNNPVSEFVKGTRPGVVLLDCLDQIKFANGFQKSLAILKDLRNLCSKNDSILLISVNPDMFEKQELQAIEKGLKEVKTG